MHVFIQKEGKTLDIEYTGLVQGLLDQLKINPEFVIIVADGVLVTTNDDITNAKKVEFLSVVSGG